MSLSYIRVRYPVDKTLDEISLLLAPEITTFDIGTSYFPVEVFSAIFIVIVLSIGFVFSEIVEELLLYITTLYLLELISDFDSVKSDKSLFNPILLVSVVNPVGSSKSY